MADLAFGPFSVDPAAGRVVRQGTELKLRPRAFQALKTLAQHGGQCVSYEQMIAEAWEGISVSKHTVDVTVGEVRKALQEYAGWITHPRKRGYCLEVPRSEDLVRRGWHYWTHSTRDGFEQAAACFTQAACENPRDFEAFRGLSRSYLMLAVHGMRPPRDMYPRFLEAHDRAVRLVGLTPELRCDRAHGLHVFERQLAHAERELLTTLAEKPTLPQVYVSLAMLCASCGRLEEAVSLIRRLSTVDPLFPASPAMDTFFYICRREPQKALDAGRIAIDLHPFQPMGRIFYAQALEDAGRIDDALAQYRLLRAYTPDRIWVRPLEIACLVRLGRKRQACGNLDELEALREVEYVDPYFMTVPYNAMGQRPRAFRELERAVDENSGALFALDVDPKMDPFRDDRRFTRLRGKIYANSRM